MGVLTTRLHGSITAIAAMATVSVWTELPDKSYLRSLSNATGQTLLLSSLYAPIASSSFDVDFSFSPPTSPPMAPMALPQPVNMPPMIRALPPMPTCASIMPFSSSASQSTAIRFHKAAPSPSHGELRSSSRSSHLGLCYPPSSRLLPPMLMCSHPLSTFHTLKLYPKLEGTASVTHNFLESTKTHASWKYPGAAPTWHSGVSALHPLGGQVSFSGISQGFRFERILSFLHGAHACPPMASTALLHMWHGTHIAPNNSEPDGRENQLAKQKPSVAVVLLGWLGAEHRHLKKYADWYTSRGIHAVTFIVPLKDLLTLKAADRAEKHVDVLTQNLVQWLKEDTKQGNEKLVIFHTFSNTGWLTYGAVLERLINQGDDFLEKIKGCVVDSAPSARPDPQVWASGFSAALLKKGSVATQKLQSGADSLSGIITSSKPSLKETALLAMLEKFFSVFLQMPYVNRRLNDVVSVLSNHQPSCPQLYIYSSADTVIPAKSVESFIEEQKKAGRLVSACNFQCSPHVDHFRTFPEKYSDQLTSFLKVCMPQWGSQ